ncbi:MAG: DUF2520 domain-containing protein [Dehalococcoidales bacterium]|nr:DUF2520 domain-containing protein [Dehalococcoidales bacterium]
MPELGFIGAGPVGTAFAVNLSQLGYRVIGIFDVVREAAQRFANDVSGCQRYEKAQDLADSADMVFITTPDDIIPKVTDGIKWRAGQSAVHCSGASTVHSLETAREQGAMVGSIHPCQTFAGREQAIANLPGSTFAIEAEEPLKTTLTEIARALKGDWVYLTSEDKALYHAAACIACNYFYTLVKIATDLWHNFGKSTEEATRAYLPLLLGSVNNIANMGFPDCLTGPIARGDVKTIQRHLAALEKYAPDILPLYKQLGLQTIPIGIAKGTLSEDKAEALRSLLENELK